MAKRSRDLSNSVISISVFGAFAVEDGDGRPIKISNRKACGVLAYLALNGGGSETRERLSGLFWSDRGEEQARASLRQCLKQLRECFEGIGFDGLETGHREIVLRKGSFRTDVERFSDGLSRREVVDEFLDGRGTPQEILYGFDTLDESFTTWLRVLRKRWTDRFTDLLHDLLRDGMGETARKAALALSMIDPSHEEACRYLMNHDAAAGNVAAALARYKSLWDLLDEEFDMEPDEATQSLVAEIKGGAHGPSDRGAPVAGPGDGFSRDIAVPESGSSLNVVESLDVQLPTINVSPFMNAGAKEANIYVFEGFRRELIAALVRFRAWVVVESERNSLDMLNEIGPGQRGDRSYAEYQLDGVYVEEAGRFRQIVTLKDRVTNRFIWSEKLDISMGSWFDSQREIVHRISIALNIYISAERLSNISSVPDVSLGIYDRWLLGQELGFRWRPEVRDRATRIFESIISDAPRFSPAYSSLAQLKNSEHLVFPGVPRSTGTQKSALDLAFTAVQLDALDSRAHLCLAWSYAMNGRYENAISYFRLSLDLNENDPWTIVSSALGLAYSGEHDEARAWADRIFAINLTPSTAQWGYQAGVRFICGDYEGCVEAAERAGDHLPYLPGWKTAALSLLGRKEDAVLEGEKFCEKVGANWFGPEMASRSDIGNWLLTSFPIRRTDVKECLRTGLSAAGIQVG